MRSTDFDTMLYKTIKSITSILGSKKIICYRVTIENNSQQTLINKIQKLFWISPHYPENVHARC